jgi:RHH-type proline utilization regulon transcriptional repressor/proline dehydrogenase/delta 1-pyrroline-5-carboxylate dehydrogenase
MSQTPDTFSPSERARIEATTLEVGRFIFDRCRFDRPHIFDRRWWDDRLMAWAMADEALKVQMFRFVDVLPMLHTSEAVTQHLQEYFHDVSQALPGAVRLGLAAASPRSLVGRAVAIAARRNVQSHARRFVAGSNTTEVLAAAMRERKLRRAFTLDILGEAVTSEIEADRYLQMYIELMRNIASTVNGWPEVPQADRGTFAALPRVNVSVKLSALDSQFDAIDPVGSTERVAKRLRPLLRVARAERAFVNVDMESYAVKDLTLAIFQQVLAEPEFRDWTDVGIVIQVYLRDSAADLVALRDWARARGTPVWIRLVKGAYWDYETIHAQAQDWPIPVFQQKWESDANFERLTEFLLRNYAFLRPALGSHNIRSLAYGIAVARHLGIPASGLELQMLYGMADHIKQVLVDMGYRLRVYMPYGQLLPGMSYLVRRLLENTSNESFLKVGFSDHVSPEKLLMNPLEQSGHRPAGPTPPKAASSAAPASVDFRNEPWADFAVAANRQAMQDALRQVTAQLGRHYPLWIDGKAVDTESRLVSVNPSHRKQVVGTVASGRVADVASAVAAAKTALPAWNALGVEARAGFLERAADVMCRRRFELAAWQVYECGKAWREADADVTEAIDFCRYYAVEARHLQGRVQDVPGEVNQLIYIPRGVVGVIAPWNFPLAILTGMTAAALATGNTVVMKPAEQSSVIAAKLMEVFNEVELPHGVLNLVSGQGETIGAALVEHPDTSLIAFTGSRAVGLAINRRAAEISAGGIGYVKRVIAEMGGKNAIIVDDDADLDEAVLGVVRSAFGYQGQKCSACSRAIVLDSIHEAFLERLVPAAQSLKVGPAEDPATSVGPVIDEESLSRIRKYIDLGRSEARQVLGVDVGPLAEEGFYVGPHIFADVGPGTRLAQEEIFGPVLAVIRAKDLDQAFEFANGTDYALTAGLYSRSPANLDRARRELLVGNLYLNRGITGAMVGRQPFGGFKLSGIGSKAGGPDYLLQFVLPRAITENTLRRGFAPPPERESGE